MIELKSLEDIRDGGVLDVGNEDVEACSGDGDVDCRGSGGHIDYGVGC